MSKFCSSVVPAFTRFLLDKDLLVDWGFLYSIPCVDYLNHKYLAQMGKGTDKKMRTGVLLITQYNPGVKAQ